MTSNFQLLERSEKLVCRFDDILINFPKKQIVLKHKIEETLYLIIECIHSYQINTVERIKEKHLKDFLVKLSMLDFYVGISVRRKNISTKQAKEICNKITELKKISFGVMKSVKQD